MNFEILDKVIPNEVISTYIEKEKRFDGRKFDEYRNFEYKENILNFEYSAFGSLGMNKVLLVLKKKIKKNNSEIENKNTFEYYLSDFTSQNNENICQNFINKLFKNNIEIKETSDKLKYAYSLYITIQTSDGNIYETIVRSLNMFLNKEKINNNKEIPITLKKQYETRTFCLINGNILIDPTEKEVERANFCWNITRYKGDTNSIIFTKINGNCIDYNLINKLINDFN